MNIRVHLRPSAVKIVSPVLALSLLIAQDTTPTFKVESKLVIVNVSVKDRSGKPITNLTKDDFIVTEDNVRQSISVFDVENLDTSLLPPIVNNNAPKLIEERRAATPPAAPTQPTIRHD